MIGKPSKAIALKFDRLDVVRERSFRPLGQSTRGNGYKLPAIEHLVFLALRCAGSFALDGAYIRRLGIGM
jgi:hypothetical protein